MGSMNLGAVLSSVAFVLSLNECCVDCRVGRRDDKCRPTPSAPSLPPPADAGFDGNVPPPTDAGPSDVPDEACPITAPSKEWTYAAPSVVRSLLVEGSVYEVEDSGGATIPLRAFDVATGTAAGSTDIARPSSLSNTHFPRLQTARFDGTKQLFVSYLSRAQQEADGGIGAAPGGLVRVGPVSSALPESADLVAGVAASVDGVFDDGDAPRVLTWDSPTSPTGKYRRLMGTAGAETIDDGVTFPGPALVFERARAAYAQGRIVGFIRTNDDGNLGAQGWTGWPVRDELPESAITMPGAVTTTANHDTLPIVYAVTATGIVTEYTVDAALQPVARVIAQLPAGYAAAGSSAKMAYTNGSVIFAAFKNGAPRLVRVRVQTGKIDEWPETTADTANGAFGWSALSAARGVACYANQDNKLRCGCLDGSFRAVE